MAWQTDEIEALRAYCDGRFTASEVAAKMGEDAGKHYTRNAIIGKVHRLRNRGDDKIKLSSQLTGRSQYAPKIVKPRLPKPPRIIKPKPEPVDVFKAGEGVTIADLSPQDCRWPLGDPATPEFRYCGQERDGERMYCKHHASIAYSPRPKKQKRQPGLEAFLDHLSSKRRLKA
jgi:GcrA cell cycle regulator